MLSWLAEQRIQEAMRNGEFADLPGHGKPLELEDLSGVPEELRMSFKIMKNAGLVPEELTLRAECVSLEELIAACMNSGNSDPAEQKSLESRLSVKRMRLQQLLRERGLESSSVFTEYGDEIHRRLAGGEI
ncbi:molecular chaperone DnaJ [Paenibacillus sp. FSL R7-0273]|uniref:DnaJ family domain-containing protein n=1 Tax=Paenibacillus sp. FSL R7-0273 TaxID=1536772 RepID=UPI0004F8534E|nr:DnaJ family domain-containing protein [Paenibacillus sp. FSL R7-0273]AIQ47017.1 molecular chaperone DnaJ [Paenibacillus sp. FSL R7-0273]OMF97224.1 molecular chaperone DnaJ [Paenibacillus sp. FSL R7-0273]